MVFNSFEAITNMVKGYPAPKRMAVAVAADLHTLEAALEARREGIATPVLVGDKPGILELLARLGQQVPEADIHHQPDGPAACALAVRLVRERAADFLMKGQIDTGVLLKAVVDKEQGLGKGGLMSHFTIFQVASYHKLLTVVDGGMVPYPTLEQKQGIIQNTVDTLLALGYNRPKVGVLACVEKLNPKMPETVEAHELAQRNRRGEIPGCVVDGPISYDCAVSAEIAAHKGYAGETAGDVDVLVAPNIHAGNIMGKMLTCTAGAKLAGMVVGAKCPIVLSSRGSTAEEKYLSIALSAAVS